MLPQGFVKSLTYALIAAVGLAALLSITLLPACLGILGRHVDALGVRTAFRVPFLRNWKVSRAYLNWLADRLQKTKTREEVEAGFWGKLVNFVMKRPLVFAIPIIVGMILLVIPLGNLSFGGISEKYLPPNNSVRVAQEHFDKLFPGYRTEQLTLVIQSDNHSPVTDQQVADIRNKVVHAHRFHQQAVGRAALPGDCRQSVRCGTQRHDPSARRLGAGDRERPGQPQRCRQEDRRAAGDQPAQGPDRLGRRYAGPGAGQHSRLVRQGSADAGGSAQRPRCC